MECGSEEKRKKEKEDGDQRIRRKTMRKKEN